MPFNTAPASPTLWDCSPRPNPRPIRLIKARPHTLPTPPLEEAVLLVLPPPDEDKKLGNHPESSKLRQRRSACPIPED